MQAVLHPLSPASARATWRIGRLNFDWRYAQQGRRDLRLDFLRGFAVFAMIVDHLGSASWLYPLTGGNVFFVSRVAHAAGRVRGAPNARPTRDVSAAEGFVLISGLLVGIVYGDIVRREGLKAATLKALARAWSLYKLCVP